MVIFLFITFVHLTKNKYFMFQECTSTPHCEIVDEEKCSVTYQKICDDEIHTPNSQNIQELLGKQESKWRRRREVHSGEDHVAVDLKTGRERRSLLVKKALIFK